MPIVFTNIVGYPAAGCSGQCFVVNLAVINTQLCEQSVTVSVQPCCIGYSVTAGSNFGITIGASQASQCYVQGCLVNYRLFNTKKLYHIILIRISDKLIVTIPQCRSNFPIMLASIIGCFTIS